MNRFRLPLVGIVAFATATCTRVTSPRVAARDPQLGYAMAKALLTGQRDYSRHPLLRDGTLLLVQDRPDSGGRPIVRAWRVDSEAADLVPVPRDSAAPRFWRGRAAVFGIDSVVEDHAYVTVQEDGCEARRTQQVVVERIGGRWQHAKVTFSSWGSLFLSDDEIAALGCRL